MLTVTSGRNLLRKNWDAFVAMEPSIAILQSWAWGEFKEQMGWKAFRVTVEEDGRILAGAQMLLKPLFSTLISVAYIPRGPVGNWLDEKIGPLLLAELHRIARLHGAVFLKIEPPLEYDPPIEKLLESRGFISSSFNNQPVATLVLNLDPDLEVILHGMRARTREYIRYSERMGVSIRIGGKDDLSRFYELMRITARREKFAPRTQTYYEQEWQLFTDLDQAVLLMAYYQEQVVAVHMAYRFGEHAAYFHGGSIKDFTKLRSNYLIMWEAIKWAKQNGCSTFDLWGIPDEIGKASRNEKVPPMSDRTDGLWGVYRFKSGFCKHVVGYLGSFDYIYSPVIYPMITNRYLNVTTVDTVLAWLDALNS